jgi:enoyl-CoA hydratase/carnithine racemase
MNYKDLTQLKLKLESNTLWITLNRPQSSNAFTVEMINELVSVLYRADNDNEVRTMVITGEGKNFCAGGDVKDMQTKSGMFAGDSNELRERYKRGIQQIPVCMNSLSTPVIAMINGAAIGAGLDLACMCDIRIGSNFAKFGETFAKLGLIPGDGGTYFLQRIVGFAKAMELTLTCEIIDASEAKNIGLLNFSVGADQLKEKTNEILSKINSNAPIALQMAKRAIVHAYKNDLQSNLDLLSAYQGITQRTSDHFEAVENIFENKTCDFKHF